MTTSKDHIREKIAKREEIEHLLRDIVADGKLTLKPHEYEGLIRAFYVVACECVPNLNELVAAGGSSDTSNLSAMTEEESRVYEAGEMGYGQYQNVPRGEVPVWYMDRAIRSAEALVRYSKSEAWRSRTQ